MCPVFVKQDIYFLSSYMEGLELLNLRKRFKLFIYFRLKKSILKFDLNSFCDKMYRKNIWKVGWFRHI